MHSNVFFFSHALIASIFQQITFCIHVQKIILQKKPKSHCPNRFHSMVFETATPAKRIRLNRKTTPDLPEPQLSLPDFDSQEHSDARKSVYLVTLPHPKSTHSTDGYPMVAPEAFKKHQVLQCFLDACARPVFMDMKSKRVN